MGRVDEWRVLSGDGLSQEQWFGHSIVEKDDVRFSWGFVVSYGGFLAFPGFKAGYFDIYL
jgi:hypothetical protein